MKKICLLLTVILLVISGCGINVESKSTTVPKLMEMTVEYADGSIVKREYVYEPTASWPANACILYENNVVVGQEDYTYDERFNTIQIIQNWDGGSTQTFELTYGNNDLISSKTMFENGIEEYTITYTYDDHDNIIEMYEYHDGILHQYTQIEYDKNGRRYRQTLYSGTGEIVCYREYSYDEKKWTETVHEYNADGILQKYLINHYDTAGMVMIEEAFNPDDTLISYSYWKYIPHTMAVTVFGY